MLRITGITIIVVVLVWRYVEHRNPPVTVAPIVVEIIDDGGADLKVETKIVGESSVGTSESF